MAGSAAGVVFRLLSSHSCCVFDTPYVRSQHGQHGCLLLIVLVADRALPSAVLAVARSSSAWSSQLISFVHILAFGTFVGTNVYTTFIAGFTMFK